MTRSETDLMALEFLRREGPHTMGPIASEEAMAAALTFIDLKRERLVSSAILTSGYVQWAITEAGLARLASAA